MNEYIERAEKLRAEIERAGARLYINGSIAIEGALEIVINSSGVVETWRLGWDEEANTSLRHLSDGSGLHALHGSIDLLMAWVKEIQTGERSFSVVRPGEVLLAEAFAIKTRSGGILTGASHGDGWEERYPLHKRRDYASVFSRMARMAQDTAKDIRESYKSLRQQKMEAKKAREVVS